MWSDDPGQSRKALSQMQENKKGGSFGGESAAPDRRQETQHSAVRTTDRQPDQAYEGAEKKAMTFQYTVSLSIQEEPGMGATGSAERRYFRARAEAGYKKQIIDALNRLDDAEIDWYVTAAAEIRIRIR